MPTVRFAARLVIRQAIAAMGFSLLLARTMALYGAISEPFWLRSDRIGFSDIANDFDLLYNRRYYRSLTGRV